MFMFQQNGSNYPMLVDHYSDYMELKSLRNTSAKTAITVIYESQEILFSGPVPGLALTLLAWGNHPNRDTSIHQPSIWCLTILRMSFQQLPVNPFHKWCLCRSWFKILQKGETKLKSNMKKIHLACIKTLCLGKRITWHSVFA